MQKGWNTYVLKPKIWLSSTEEKEKKFKYFDCVDIFLMNNDVLSLILLLYIWKWIQLHMYVILTIMKYNTLSNANDVIYMQGSSILGKSNIWRDMGSCSSGHYYVLFFLKQHLHFKCSWLYATQTLSLWYMFGMNFKIICI